MNAKAAKKIRREVNGLKQAVASDLKTYIQNMGFFKRLALGFKITWRMKW